MVRQDEPSDTQNDLAWSSRIALFIRSWQELVRRFGPLPADDSAAGEQQPKDTTPPPPRD